MAERVGFLKSGSAEPHGNVRNRRKLWGDVTPCTLDTAGGPLVAALLASADRDFRNSLAIDSEDSARIPPFTESTMPGDRYQRIHQRLTFFLWRQAIPPGKKDKQDAVEVRLDHVSGYSVKVLLPYAFSKEGKVEFAPSFAARGERKIF
jgi:hypothetical protein